MYLEAELIIVFSIYKGSFLFHIITTNKFDRLFKIIFITFIPIRFRSISSDNILLVKNVNDVVCHQYTSAIITYITNNNTNQCNIDKGSRDVWHHQLNVQLVLELLTRHETEVKEKELQ